jgi:hypothetical protein
VCTAGNCVLSCAPGLANCSGTCRDLQSDRANCGTCGRACASGEVCGSGTCTLSCPSGQTACSGVCATLSSDRNNCGTCGRVCSDPTNAFGFCSSSTCGYGCRPGFADCDANGGNGCEVNTTNSTTNCGACNNVCPTRANAATVCASSTCTFTCNTGFANCNNNAGDGCEVNTTNDNANCGACNAACPSRPNAANTCSGSACRLTCNAGFGNCNSNEVDGCEADLNTSNANCGACGNACATGRVCRSGACVATTFTGYTVSSGPSAPFLNACGFGSQILSGSDDTTTGITLPFSFTYYAGMFTSGWASTNGVAGFGPASAAFSNSCLPSGIANAVHGFWDDLDTRSTGRVCAGTTGTSPDRRYVVTWSGVYFFASDDGSRMNFSIVFHEGSNLIDLMYDTMSSPQAGRAQGNSATIGVQGPSGQSTQFSCNSASVATGTRLRFTPM